MYSRNHFPASCRSSLFAICLLLGAVPIPAAAQRATTTTTVKIAFGYSTSVAWLEDEVSRIGYRMPSLTIVPFEKNLNSPNPRALEMVWAERIPSFAYRNGRQFTIKVNIDVPLYKKWKEQQFDLTADHQILAQNVTLIALEHAAMIERSLDRLRTICKARAALWQISTKPPELRNTRCLDIR